MNYFISDTHFGHNNILVFERTQFNTIEEHDDFIMTVMEKSLKETDTLYHLGDFGYSNPNGPIYTRFKALPCHKVLIKGNHDKASFEYYQDIFDIVSETPIYLTKRVVLSHDPIPVTEGSLNLHGHLHGAVLKSYNHLNLNIHITKYQLLTMKAVEKKLGTLSIDNTEFLYEWYAPLYHFTAPKDDVVASNRGDIDLSASRLLQVLQKKQ